MASNKNQHFVPRCYLRPFAVPGVEAAINLYNLDRQKMIAGAPLKHQCSGSYFYGRDARLEEAIQTLERDYSAVLTAVAKPAYVLSDGHRQVLRYFWLFQHLRTEAASRRAVEMNEMTIHTAGVTDTSYQMEIKEAVQMALRTFVDSMHVIDDLKVCLLRNRTATPFVTSDDPAVLANRWFDQSKRARGMSYGVTSAGALMLLPMTPKVFCIAYDGDVYSIANTAGWAEVRRTRDVEALNEHQFLNCRANIFFQDAEDAQFVHESYLRALPCRPGVRHRVNYAVLDSQDGDYKKYRVVSRADAEAHTEAMIHTQVIHPRASAWPHILTWRPKGAVFTNGTGVGYVRRGSTYRSDMPPFRAEDIVSDLWASGER